ncbi:MAG: hypothetical protein JNJ70_05590 [Verrucomicrobiales bacterium]|nr:hypothetical protein [Verrucomicrobiales bacterium]
MIAYHYLERGIAGFGRAHLAGSMSGHLGSALLAGYFLGEMKPDLDPAVHFAIERDLERILGGEESVWFDPAKVGMTVEDLFEEPESAETGKSDGIRIIVSALEPNLGKLRQSGHNAIFASLAIRAFSGHPGLATPARIEGARKLIAAFDTQGPGRGYLGKDRGWVSPRTRPEEEGIETPAYDDLVSMAVATFDFVIETAGEHRRGYGDHFHLIDHAAALIDLADCGLPGLAQDGIRAHREHLARLRALPVLDEELGRLKKSELDPFDPDYWRQRQSVQWDAWLTHRVKCLHGFVVVSRLVEDNQKREAARDAMRYLMA